MDGLSIHHYSLPTIQWSAKKGSATNFSVNEWASTLRAAFNVEPLLARTAAILDRYDPLHRIGIVLDEWGTWYDVEPGTEPGFLYQQNTIRDALVAGLTLNILNTWSHRVHMANIAQTINVLQAMVLTDRDKMILTPTYHVFEMYKSHQDATLLPSHLECDDYTLAAHTMPQISASRRQRRDAHLPVQRPSRKAGGAGVRAAGRRVAAVCRCWSHPHRGNDERPQHVRKPRRGEACRVHRLQAPRQYHYGFTAAAIGGHARCPMSAPDPCPTPSRSANDERESLMRCRPRSSGAHRAGRSASDPTLCTLHPLHPDGTGNDAAPIPATVPFPCRSGPTVESPRPRA